MERNILSYIHGIFSCEYYSNIIKLLSFTGFHRKLLHDDVITSILQVF